MARDKTEDDISVYIYSFIDQAYAWALQGMKFVSILKMDECLTVEACREMIKEFDEYMKDHPPIPAEDFHKVSEMCHRWGDMKCLRQCSFAEQKCNETLNLFNKRRQLLQKIKEQLKVQNKKRTSGGSVRSNDKEKVYILSSNHRTVEENSLEQLAKKSWENQESSIKDAPADLIDSSLYYASSKTSSRSSSAGRESVLNQESLEKEENSKSIELSKAPWENRKSTSHNVSTSTTESSSARRESVKSPARSSTSHGLVDFNELSLPPKSSSKPARKAMKKSSKSSISQTVSDVHSHSSGTVSHVHSHSGETITIGSPVQVNERRDTTGKSKVALIIEELIATEEEYVRSLNYVVENYFPEMCRLDIPQTLRCKRNIIFGNIEKIAEFHSCYFLRDLQKCIGNPLMVAKTFQLHKKSFGLYALYTKNKPQSDHLMLEYGNDFFQTKQTELNDKMNLASYLLKPVQRMGKYALLLHAMSKQCSASEVRSLRDAEELVKFQLRHGNDLLTMDSIQNCDVNLKEQGNLLRQEEFNIFSGRRKFVRRVFLFEDMILFSKPVRINGGHDLYLYKCSYKTAEIGLTESIGECGYKFEIWFRRRRLQATQDRFVLQSTSRAIKRSWVEEIRGLLWKQALKNKDHRQMELSSMGVGNKPHLDLTGLSENRIRDRSVIVLPSSEANMLADRLAKSRSRASVAVTHFDHHSRENKRPHSIISTSSASSVGSGGIQSFSLISSLHLASWPSKSFEKSNSFSTPMAYCDFLSIAEDKSEEDSESTISSTSTPRKQSVGSQNESPISKQFVTTPNQSPHAVN